MSPNTEIFFKLLRNALWHQEESLSKELSPQVTSLILQMAKDQTVSGLIIDALIRNDIHIGQKAVFESVGILEQIKETNRQLNKELLQFSNLMKQSQIEYVVVKGQTVASLYLEPLLRMPGDIDFLVSDYRSSSKVIADAWNIEFPESLIDKEVAFNHNGVTYELHTVLMQFGSHRHRKVWRALMNTKPSIVKIENADVLTVQPMVNAIYLFVHLFFHFIREGVGLRQLCDWAMLLKHYQNEIDSKKLESMLNSLGLINAFKAFGSILVDKLGLLAFPLKLTEKDRRYSEKLLNDILKSGNFGHNIRQTAKLGFAYKMETLKRTARNCCCYFRLAPLELSLIIPRLAWLNLKIMITGSK